MMKRRDFCLKAGSALGVARLAGLAGLDGYSAEAAEAAGVVRWPRSQMPVHDLLADPACFHPLWPEAWRLDGGASAVGAGSVHSGKHWVSGRAGDEMEGKSSQAEMGQAGMGQAGMGQAGGDQAGDNYAGDNHAGRGHVSHGGDVTHIHKPGLYILPPARPNGAAVIIAGGGGYGHIAVGHEALPAAYWLTSLGITPAILLYRLPGEGRGQGRRAEEGKGAAMPLADARQALHLLCSGHVGEGIDPQRVGFMGFSAGGHLAGLAGLQASMAGSAYKPALMMLLYPIVSLMPPFAHSHTARSLLGSHPRWEAQQRWSLPPYVHDQAPPLFLAHAADDPIAPPGQDALLLHAYQQDGRPCEHHLFASGGHGFGMGHRHGPTHHWALLAENWLREQKFLSR